MDRSGIVEVLRGDPAAQGVFSSWSGEQIRQTQESHRTSNTQRNNSRPTMSTRNNIYPDAQVRITEQPAPKALRFRYECEGRSAGSIPGANSTSDNKTYPSIQIVNYRGPAVVVVSCVTKDKPYRVHPHKLVGKDNCGKGVCTTEINNESMSASFANLGIECVKKKDIEESLLERKNIRVDPFRKGFDHATQPSSIDLNAVRLCFQVFLKGLERQHIPIEPIVSDPIYDKKAMSDLVICKLSKPSSSVAGGEDIILLCEKVAKDDIQVRFFEEKTGWEAFGEFQHTNLHKQVAISFRTPKYRALDVEQPAKCFIQLRRPSDNAVSEALPFEYRPLDSDKIELKRKRLRTGNELNIFPHDGSWMQQQNFLQLPNVKQEPISPNYADLPSTSTTPPPPQRYTPSPNILNAIPFTSGISMAVQQQIGGYIPSVSPLQHANMLNQPYHSPTNQNQINIPNVIGNTENMDFLNNNPNLNLQIEQRNIEDILTNNLENMNGIEQNQNTNQENALDSVSGMNISNLLDLDSQPNTSQLLSSDLLNDLMKTLDNGGNGANQLLTPVNLNAIGTNNLNADEDNMTDSFKQCSLE